MNAENNDEIKIIVSVVMPVFNGGKYLKAAIESILEQTFIDFEFIIINDGSSDNSEKIIKSFSDKRIKYVDNIDNKGLVFTLNRGVEMAKGKYIARMDADDISLNTRFEKQVTFLEKNSNISIIASTVKLINEDDHTIGFWNEEKNKISTKDIYNYLPIDNCIAHPSIMVKSECLKLYGYKIDQALSEDYDLWLRMAADGIQICKLNEDLLLHRIIAHSFTRTRQRNNFYKLSKVKKKFFINQLKNRKINLFIFRTGCYSIIDFFKGFIKEIKKRITI